MLSATEQWQNFYDPATFGLTEQGIYWGTCAQMGLMGFAIPQDEGEEEVAGVALFRGGHNEPVDYGSPVGIGLGKPSQVKNFLGVGHTADTWYRYDQRAFNAAGVISHATAAPTMLRASGSGRIIDPPVPNPPSFISVRRVTGGRFLVAIGYAPAGQAVSPTDLRVYGKTVTDPDAPDTSGLWDIGNLQTDDVTGDTEINCHPAFHRYRFNVVAKADEQYWIFGAVFRNAGGVAGDNEVVSNVVRADAAAAQAVTSDDWELAINA